MQGWQKILNSILPQTWAEDMERESRQWMVQCPDCGTERSVWEMGGVRWKAKGEPRREIPCEVCKKLTSHKVYHKKG